MKSYRRILIAGGIVALMVTFFASGLHRQLSLETLKNQQARFQESYQQQPVVMIAAFSAIYIPVVALNLPGAVVLGLAAGALFGTFTGTLIVSFASSIGATLACLLSRYLLRDWVQKRFGEKLKKVNAGIRKEGSFYLFALRLMPIIPFFVINLVMGLVPMRLWTFYWVSQLGMLPGTAVFVNAGSQLGRIDSLSGILSPGLLLSLALLGIFPLAIRRTLGALRNRSRQHPARRESGAGTGATAPAQAVMTSLLNEIRDRCTECGACQPTCKFLSQYGTPKQIATDFDFSSPTGQKIAYECSLCGLCASVCPEKLTPEHLFLEVRRRSVDDGNFNPATYRTILGYEKRGISPFFSWYGFPEGCDTVFFPGCTLPGTRPAVTLKMYRRLTEVIPNLGVVLDCCTKPSHDLGQARYFKDLFNEMNDYLVTHGIHTVLTACPNCTKIFRQYGRGIETRTVYEALINPGEKNLATKTGISVTVHDPCAMRNDLQDHQAVRMLLTGMGFDLKEMKHRGKRTLCCGEGGTVGAVNPGFARTWAVMRAKEAGGQKVVTYCAGCAGYLSQEVETIHIADLLFRTETALYGDLKIARAPLTYWNRLRLKQTMKREVRAKIQRVRPSEIAVDAAGG